MYVVVQKFETWSRTWYTKYMEKIQTDSFELAVTTRGDENGERLLLCLPGRLDTKDYAHMQSHIDYFATKGFSTAAL